MRRRAAVDTIEAWRRRYQQAGITTIPLPSFSKAAAYPWTSVPPAEAWLKYADSAGNIGILLGNTLACLEQDTPVATDVVDAWSSGLGVELPTVYSATPDHRHSYLRCKDVPQGFTLGKLGCDGISDLRTSHAYAVAPPSAVYGDSGLRYYRWSNARTMERDVRLLMTQRPIAWRDLEPLLLHAPSAAQEQLDSLPVRLLWRPAYGALQRLAESASAPRGRRSELEASAVCAMAVSGWNFDEVARAFAEVQPGHYRDAGQYGEQYLWHTWCTACTYLAAQGERPAIAVSYRTASEAAWPGRSGAYDKATYLALLAICWQVGDWTAAASVRDLAQHAAITPKAASTAMRRLRLDYDLAALARDTEYGRRSALTYEAANYLVWSKGNISHSLKSTIEAGSCGSSSSRAVPAASGGRASEHELWATARLGQSAGLVYQALSGGEQTIAELQAATGKARRTVERALLRLQSVGLAANAGDRWQRGEVSLAVVAEALECEQAARLRRAEHERQREAWRELVWQYDERRW